MNDINLQDQAHHHNNQVPKTFDEMCTYLLSKPNCSIQGGFFTITDMQRAFDAYLNGQIDNVGVLRVKPFSPH